MSETKKTDKQLVSPLTVEDCEDIFSELLLNARYNAFLTVGHSNDTPQYAEAVCASARSIAEQMTSEREHRYTNAPRLLTDEEIAPILARVIAYHSYA